MNRAAQLRSAERVLDSACDCCDHKPVIRTDPDREEAPVRRYNSDVTQMDMESVLASCAEAGRLARLDMQDERL
jgi:hypothetical protein